MPRLAISERGADLLKLLLFAVMLLAAWPAFASEKIIAARAWPAKEYTRVTFEFARSVKHELLVIESPPRLAVDLEDVELDNELRALPAKIGADDPYIQAVRVAYNRPGVVRVVFDLRSAVKPYLFPLAPAGEYKHRLVLDLYPPKPLNEPDPIREMAQGAMPPALPPTASVTAPPAAVARVELMPKRPVKDRLVIVAIDAGHGGEDPGARGRRGTNEKDVTLAIARRLKASIDKESNMRAVLVRDGDYFIPLAQRVEKARRNRADLFVSIHADAWVRPDARGSSVFALSERGATTAAARWLAKRENESDLIGGVNLDVRDPVLARTLLDLSQTATINDSLKLGKAVLSQIGDVNSLHKPSVEQAGFAVLKAPDIPSILVETAFISNPDEEKRLKDAAYQEKLATAIVQGIKRYLSQNPPLARDKLAER
jgi:N-acetylmuramoyl-L-alanine amidase